MPTSEVPDFLQDILRTHLAYADAGDLREADGLASLGLDSMGLVALMADLEDNLGVQLPDEFVDEATFATVGSLWSALVPLLVPPQGVPE